MDKCTSCKFYTPVPFWKPVCKKIPNIRLDSPKVKYFDLPDAYRICKGYFYDPKDNRDVDTSYDR